MVRKVVLSFLAMLVIWNIVMSGVAFWDREPAASSAFGVWAVFFLLILQDAREAKP